MRRGHRAVTKIWHGKYGKQRRVLEGLPSLAGEGGADAIGPSDISFGLFSAYLTVGLGADPAVRADLAPLGSDFAKLYRVSPFGRVRAVADLAGYDKARTRWGAGQQQPQLVLALPGRRYVVDAGANDLLRWARPA